MAYNPPSDTEIKEALDIIWAAPQAQMFTKERVSTYVHAVIEAEEDLLFHAKRLHSIGPSEAGFLVTSFRNHTRKPGQPFESSFRSAYDVYREKLLLSLPEKKPELQRGNRAEATIRTLYIEQLQADGHKVREATEEKARIKEWRQSEAPLDKRNPWLRSINLDDLMYINERLTLVDYKATSAEMLEKLKNDIGTPYKVQLHLYNHGLSQLGIQVDDMNLVPFNYNEWKAEEISVPYDSELLDQTFDACGFYYDLIVSGKRPPIIKSTEEVFDPSKVSDRARDLASEIGVLGALEDNALLLRQSKTKELCDIFSKYDSDEQVTVVLGPVNVTMKSRKVYDEPGLITVASDLGFSVAKKDKPEKIAKQIAIALTEQGRDDINLDDYIDIVRTTTARAATGNSPGAHLRNALKQNAEELVSSIAQTSATELRSVHDIIDDDALKQERYARGAQELFKQLYEDYTLGHTEHIKTLKGTVEESIELDEDLLATEMNPSSSSGMSEEQSNEIRNTGGFVI